MENSHAELVRKISETLSDMQEDLEDACIGPIRKFLCISRRVAAVFDEYLLAEVHLERGTKKHTRERIYKFIYVYIDILIYNYIYLRKYVYYIYALIGASTLHQYMRT